MARWKLMAPHYLNLVVPSEWEHNETTRDGKSMRKRYIVPTMLDPRDPNCWTNTWGLKDNAEGEIILCRPGKGEPRDLEFESDPTPDMVPLDDEARAISAQFEPRWAYKPEGQEVSYSQSMIDKFQVEIGEIKSKPTEIAIPGLEALTAALTEQSKLVTALLAAQSGPTAPTLRR